MPRTVSALARQAMYAPETGECFVVLLELSHPNMATPIQVCSDSVDTVHLGQTFQHFPFQISMPADTDDAPPRVELAIDAIDRSIIQAVRSLTGAPITVRQWIVLASTPDTIEAGPFEFELREVEYDAFEVRGSLRYTDLAAEPYPSDTFTPTNTPGIF